MSNEQRVVELVIDASPAEAGAKRLAAALDHVGESGISAQDKLNKASTQAQRIFSATPQSTDRLLATIDRQRAAYDPIFAAQLRATNETLKFVSAHEAALKRGLISEEQYTRNLTALKNKQIADIQRVTDAQSKSSSLPPPANNNGLSEGNRRFIGRDIAFQAQDIATTAIGGMSPKVIAFQQGTQIAGAVSGLSAKEAGGALLSAAGNLLNPISIASIALTGLAAAGIQYFTSSAKSAKTLDDALKANNDNVQILKESFHQLAEAASISPNLGGNSVANANLRSNDVVMRAVARQQGDAYMSTIEGNDHWYSGLSGSGTPIQGLQKLSGPQADFKAPVDALLQSVRQGSTDFATFDSSVEKTYATLLKTSDQPQQLRETADAIKALAHNSLEVSSSISILGADGKTTTASLKPFAQAIDQLKVGIADGNPDYVRFASTVEKIGQSNGLQRVADQVIVLAKDLLNLNKAMTESDLLQRKLFDDRGPNGRLLSQGTTNRADDNDAGIYSSQQKVALARSKQAFDAQIAAIGARSPTELASSARTSAGAQYSDEGPSQRSQRVDQAGVLAQTQAEFTLSEAQKERARSLDETIASQQLSLQVIGKTGDQVAALRMQYQLTSQLEADAAKNHIAVNQQELASIKAKSEEYGRLASQIARATAMSDLEFDRDQFYRNSVDKQIASRQRSAGLPVDLSSTDAQYQRRTAQIEAARDMQRSQQAFDAQISGMGARSPSELAAAARTSAAAQHNDSETAPQRSQRIEEAGILAQKQAEFALSEAQKERTRSLNETIASQQLNLQVIGKTGGEVAALRMQYQLTSQLETDAAKNHIAVNQQELASIKAKSEEYGRLTDQVTRANAMNDLQFERDQIYRNPVDQQIASRQRGAGLPVDMNSSDAQFQRQTSQIDAVRTGVKGFFSDFEQTLVSNGGKAGEALGTAFKNALLSSTAKFADQALDKLVNFFADAILGTGKSGAASVTSSAGSVVGIAGKLFGGAANDNAAPAAISSAVPTTSIASFIAQGALQRNMDPGIALKVAQSEGGLASWNQQSGVLKNGVQEPSFGPYQLYMNGGLGNAFMKQTGLNPADAANGPAGVNFALDYAKKNGWGSWYGAKNAGIGNWDGINAGDGGSAATDASKALDKLAGSAGTATQGLGTLGNGLQSLGSNFFPAAPQAAASSGGIGSWFSSIFSGAFKPNGAQASLAASGSIVGLFDRGGFTGHGGVNDPAGVVHRGEVVWSQRDVARAGGVAAVEGMRLGYRGYANGGGPDVPPIRRPAVPSSNNDNSGGIAGVRVYVDDDGKWQAKVEGIATDRAQRVSQQGFADYGEAQRRGGIGQVQNRWASQKN